MADEITKREVGERVDLIMSIEQATVKDLGDGSFSAIITTSDEDRMGESISTDGIGYDAYMQNPVVLYGHDYQGLPIGKTLKLTKNKGEGTGKKNAITAVFQLAVQEYPFAKTVADMIKGGYLNAVSIGGIVKAWSGDFTEILAMEMVEFSVVPVPANPKALITARSFEHATGKTVEQVASEFHQFVEKSVMKKVDGLDTSELNRHIESLETLLGILKASSEEKAKGVDNEKVVLTLRKTAGKVSETGQQIIRLVKPKG